MAHVITWLVHANARLGGREHRKFGRKKQQNKFFFENEVEYLEKLGFKKELKFLSSYSFKKLFIAF